MPAPPRPTPPAHARSPRRPAATALAVGLVALVLAFNPAATRPARAYPGSAVTLVGHGWGHGRGMGQYGALGYALGGWGYGAFEYDAASDAFSPATEADSPPQGHDAKCGFACLPRACSTPTC